MDATSLQTSFLGGAIAQSFQGRADHPKYKTGLALCYNSLPVEQGAWTRRPGTRTAALTRAGAYAKIIDFDFSQNTPYTIELTDSHARFFITYGLLLVNPEVVQSISTANPAVVTVSGNTVFNNGDSVQFYINAQFTPEQGALLQDRQFLVGSVSGATFTISDPVTGAGIDGSTLNFTAGTPAQVLQVQDVVTLYTRPMLPNVRGVQALNGSTNTLVLLHPQVPMQALTSTVPPAPVFSITAATLKDGPYLDPPNIGGPTITPGAASGSGITLTASSALFAATDVGRFLRLFSQPANWAVGTAYTAGNLVTYNDAYYTALQSTTGNIPGTDAVNWGPAVNASAWVWATITAFTNSTHVTATFNVTPTLPGVLVNTNAITDANYQFGLFNQISGYPSCGAYHEGRLWISGVVGNRIDSSVSNDIFNFSPSAVDDTVSDENAMTEIFNAQDINTIVWMTPQQTGLLCGTQAGEWLIQASSAGSILTPTSIQSKRITKYGDANVEPINAPFATLFVARNNKKVFEYLADVFTGKYSAINVSLTGSNLLLPGVDEIRYQKELCPVAWLRMDDGSFAGMTYRRESPMLSEQPAFAGWHSHALGTNRSIISIAVGPNVTGNLDALSMVTLDPVDGLYRVEVMTDIFPDNGTNLQAWFVDGGTTPVGSFLTSNSLTIYGLEKYNGSSVSVYIAGIDVGDFAVSGGEISIALPVSYGGGNLLSAAAIAAANNNALIGTPTGMPVTYAINAFPTDAQDLQSYIGPTTPVTGVNTDNILVDVPNNRLFAFKSGTGSTAGIRVLNITSGVQTNQATHDQIFGANTARNVINPYALGYDGRIYTVDAASNSTQYIKLDQNTLRLLETAGQDGSSLTPAPNNIPAPANLAPIRIGGKSFVIAPSSVASLKSINVVEMTDGSTQNAGHNFQMTEGPGYSCGSYDGSGLGYTLGKIVGTHTGSIGVYQTLIAAAASGYNLADFPTVQNPYISTTKLGTITPTQIDATWTNITSMSGPCFDQSDGNLLAFVNTADAVTNPNYLIKINSQTAAVMWATAVINFPSNESFNMPASYAAYGVFAYVTISGGTHSYIIFNTLTGAATVTAVVGFSTINASVWDARLGAVFFNASFAQGGGSPTLLNATPTSYAAQWAALYVGNVVGTTPTIATGRAYYTVPAAIGTTFTSKGQLLRPLSPQDTGARNGPALGKTRRDHRFAALLLNTAGISFGTTFDKLHAALFKSLGGKTTYAANQLYSGVWTNPLEDNNSYDGQLCWQISRPYPATVLAVQPFLETQDR